MLPPLTPVATLLDAYGSPQVRIGYASGMRMLHVQFLGHITSPEIIRIGQQVLPIQQQLRCPLLLKDKRQATGDWLEALDWLEYEWLPQAMEAGLRAEAYVFQPDLLSMLTDHALFARTRQHMLVRQFYALEPALHWLASLPEQSAPVPST